jgi:hypothetical protein
MPLLNPELSVLISEHLMTSHVQRCEATISASWVLTERRAQSHEALHSRAWRITQIEAYVCKEIASTHGRVRTPITRTQNRNSFPHQPCYGRRHYATSQKGAGSIPDEVIRLFNWPDPSSSIIALRVDSVPNGNEYQESSWRWRAVDRCVRLTTSPSSMSSLSGKCRSLDVSHLMGLHGLLQGQFYTNKTVVIIF